MQSIASLLISQGQGKEIYLGWEQWFMPVILALLWAEYLCPSKCSPTSAAVGLNWQSTEWGKIFAIYPPDKGLISKIYKELKQIYKKKKTHSKLGEGYEQTLFKRRHI